VTTKLQIFNGALLELGERNLASLSESREPRRLLDAVWDTGALNFCLNAGQWKFATRSSMLESSPSVTPAFGYANAFEIPSDFVRTVAFCADEYFNSPITQYSSEGGFWFSDVEPIYLKYVSNDTDYGADFSLWPPNFILYVQAYLASRIAKRNNQNKSDWQDLMNLVGFRLKEAKASDAMEGPTQFPPSGSWVRSRSGSNGERASRNRLTG
jgi:hypothetical protein